MKFGQWQCGSNVFRSVVRVLTSHEYVHAKPIRDGGEEGGGADGGGGLGEGGGGEGSGDGGLSGGGGKSSGDDGGGGEGGGGAEQIGRRSQQPPHKQYAEHPLVHEPVQRQLRPSAA